MRSSFGKVFMGAAGSGGPSDDEFNRVSFMSHFEGANNGVNNAFDDGSTSNHTITANGNVTQGSFGPFARPDGEWAFNNTASTNDSFKVTAHDNFDMTNPFTIEGWIFIPDLAVNKLLFGRENNYWMTHDYQGIGGASGKLGFSYQNSGSWGTINASAATVANTWYFLQATYVGTTVTFYINGVSQGTASVGSPSSNTDKPFYVLSGPGAKATGTASNVRLSSVARSTSLPTSKFTSDSDTELLVCQSNRFVDNGPDGHTITTTAGASVSAFGPFLTSAVYDAAVNGASAYFDGSGDRLHTPEDASTRVAASNFTFEAWVYSTTTTTSQKMIFTQGAPGVYAPFNVYVQGTTVRIYISTNGSSWNIASNSTSSNPVQVKAWNHISLVRNGTTIGLYINGVADNTYAVSTTAFFTPTRETSVGGRDGEEYFPGYITDARLVIGTAVYTSAFTLPTAPLTAITNTKLLLNMADGQAIDSAAQNNLTLFGNAKISTGQAKFGDTSLYLDGTGDAAQIATTTNSFAFGTGDYTVEMWLYLTAVNENDQIFDMRTSDSSVNPGSYLDSSARPNLYISGGVRLTSNTAISANTWTHFAICRASGTTRIFQAGQVTGTLNSDTYNIVAGKLMLGARYNSAGTNNGQGYWEDVRVSKMARYTSNFTAPAEAFPDKGQ